MTFHLLFFFNKFFGISNSIRLLSVQYNLEGLSNLVVVKWTIDCSEHLFFPINSNWTGVQDCWHLTSKVFTPLMWAHTPVTGSFNCHFGIRSPSPIRHNHDITEKLPKVSASKNYMGLRLLETNDFLYANRLIKK
jgi:hypothetical protein